MLSLTADFKEEERSLGSLIVLSDDRLPLDDVGVEYLNGVHDSGDLLGLRIADVEAEVFFHGEDQFNAVERVEAEVFEGGRARQLVVVALGSGLEDLEDLAFDVLDDLVFV